MKKLLLILALVLTLAGTSYAYQRCDETGRAYDLIAGDGLVMKNAQQETTILVFKGQDPSGGAIMRFEVICLSDGFSHEVYVPLNAPSFLAAEHQFVLQKAFKANQAQAVRLIKVR